MHKRSKMVKNKLKLTFFLQDVWKPVLYILQKQCICSLRDWCQTCNLHVQFYFLSWTYQGSWGVGTLCEWQFIHFKRCHSVWLLFHCLKFGCLCSFDFFYSIRLRALFPVTSLSLWFMVLLYGYSTDEFQFCNPVFWLMSDFLIWFLIVVLFPQRFPLWSYLVFLHSFFAVFTFSLSLHVQCVFFGFFPCFTFNICFLSCPC